MKRPSQTFCGLLRPRLAEALFASCTLSSARVLQTRLGNWGIPVLPFASLLFLCRKLSRPYSVCGRAHRLIDCNKFEAQVAPARQPILKSRQRACTVCPLLAMAAVMQTKDFPGAGSVLQAA